MNHRNQYEKAKDFYQLHQQPTSFVLPNAWDAVSAKVFEESGFEAIGTTSAGIAASLGYDDGQNIPFEEMTTAIKNIATSVDIPVSADIEAGYGETISEIVDKMKKVTATGVVAINIEDGTGNSNQTLYDISFQQEKIAAIKELSDSHKESSLFINARTDTYWLNIGNPSEQFEETVKRIKSFVKAGADCIFVPGLNNREIIKNLRNEIACPINLLASPETPSLTELSRIGVERLSCGSGPFRSSVTLLKAISEEIINQQSFHRMTDGVLPYGEVTKLMGGNSNG
ncbi:dihydrouridine synthase [Virgibacillus indicus]|uniref:Dihydrouridine synthase n=1 Tax=Virgibacillus indicus TaxID=2024554 RepID=A0A265NA34_9BACI|nr:isocitrate lyase/phosphoenolpyruvate mutase family protein [Virgibacillus indicus]OZU88655.1 dihydrouridine synthase [Virgibacillus indicus]